jgi:hypothetical protein
MIRCPNCDNELVNPDKTWKYNVWDVQFFICDNCEARVREYTRNGRHSFTLMLIDGHYRKVAKKVS